MKGIAIIIGLYLTLLLAGCNDRVEPSNSYTSPSPVVSQSKTLEVPGEYTTIQEAVIAAQNGDFIRVAAGVYNEDVLVIREDLSLRGAGIGQTVIIGTVTIEYSSEASVEGFTIKSGGVVVRHSQIRISGNEILNSPGPGLRLEHCPGSIISDNTIASNGTEGILSDESDGVYGNNIVKHNRADGIVINNASPTLQANFVAENQRDGIAIRGFRHYAAPLLLQNKVWSNGGISNYDIICFGDNTNPTGTGNQFGQCLNCAECRTLGGPVTYQD